MENIEEIKKRAKQLILDSPVKNMAPEEKIEEVFNNIVMVKSKEEFEKLCIQFGINPRMQAAAFTNGQTIYLGLKDDVDKLIHNIVHELLHRMSKKWDKDGNVIQNGMQCTKGQRFSNFVNEGITDYLAKRIVGGDNCQYVHESRIIEALDKEMIKYFDDSDVLFSMYLQDDNTGLENKRFKEFLDSTKGEGAYDELYENISFMNVNEPKTQKYLEQVSKGVKRHVRKRNIKRTIDTIKGIFGGNTKQKMLEPKQEETQLQTVSNSVGLGIIGGLQEQVNETYEEFPPRNKTGIEEQQL